MEPTKDNYEPSKAMGAMFDAFELGQKSNSNDLNRLKTEHERSLQELQAYRDIIKELIPIAERTTITVDNSDWREQWEHKRTVIDRAKTLIDTVTPT